MSEITVVLLGGRDVSTNMVYHALSKRFRVARAIVEDPVPRKQFLKRRARKLGYLTVAGQILFRILAVPLLNALSRSRIAQIQAQYGLDDTPIPPERLLHVTSVNSDESLDAIRECHPDVVVLNGTRIVAERILSGVDACFINTHAGITPLYRGVHGAYWALLQNDRAHCGVTVHLVDTGIDTGNILAQANINPTAADNFVTYPLLQLGEAIPLLIDAIENAAHGKIEESAAPQGESRLWSHPTIWQYLWHRFIHGVK